MLSPETSGPQRALVDRPRLPRSAGVWPSEGFATTLVGELIELGPATLPLQAALTPGGRIEPGSLRLRCLAVREAGTEVLVKLGAWFSESLSGCVCGDDPTSTEAGYCELEVRLAKGSGEARIRLLTD